MEFCLAYKNCSFQFPSDRLEAAFGSNKRAAKVGDGSRCCNNTEVTKSQGNRRQQRRLQIFLKNSCKVVDLLVQKLLNYTALDSCPLMDSSPNTGQS